MPLQYRVCIRQFAFDEASAHALARGVLKLAQAGDSHWHVWSEQLDSGDWPPPLTEM